MIWAVNFNFINHVVINKEPKKNPCVWRGFTGECKENSIISCLHFFFSFSSVTQLCQILCDPMTTCGPLEEGMANRSSILALRTPRSVFSLAVYYYYFLAYRMAYEILVAQPRIRTVSPAVEVCTFNCWTIREVPHCWFYSAKKSRAAMVLSALLAPGLCLKGTVLHQFLKLMNT